MKSISFKVYLPSGTSRTKCSAGKSKSKAEDRNTLQTSALRMLAPEDARRCRQDEHGTSSQQKHSRQRRLTFRSRLLVRPLERGLQHLCVAHTLLPEMFHRYGGRGLRQGHAALPVACSTVRKWGGEAAVSSLPPTFGANCLCSPIQTKLTTHRRS
jgi:hypothetical protein